MPAETLQLNFSRIHRPNQRRVRYPILHAIGRLVLLVVALMVLIAVLMKLGVIEETRRLISVATGFRPSLTPVS